MDNKKIDFVVHEADMNRIENHNKRLFILCVVLIGALLLTFTSFIIYSVLPCESAETTQTLTDFESIENSTITNGES